MVRLKKGWIIILGIFVMNLIFSLILNNDFIYSILASLIFSPVLALIMLRQTHFENDIFGRWLLHILIWVSISAFVVGGIAFCLIFPFSIKVKLLFGFFYFIPPILVFLRYRKLIRNQ